MVSRISEQTPNIINDKGDVVSTITNFRFKVNRYILETGARSYFSTGSIDHQATLQVSYYHDRLAIASTWGQTVDSNIYSRQTLMSPCLLRQPEYQNLLQPVKWSRACRHNDRTGWKC